VWSEVLEIDRVGVTDSLFALGGDSLHAARIVNRLTPICGSNIRITTLFEHPTIRALARQVASDTPAVQPTTAPAAGHSIAIIGMACRFPGADSVDEFWNNLRSARDSITFFRPDDLEADDTPERGQVLARGLLSDVDCFDARLFRLTPGQAQMLDPQQRVWLECVHRAMEDAGLPVGGSDERAGANIGVFAGGRESSYLWHLVGGDRRSVEALLTGAEDALELLNSNDRDSIATRTSYLLGFTGPSINVQTACSTSLVAVAQACQALVSRQCDVAIAGGVAVSFPQKRGHRHQAGGIYSRDGHCRPFDADASGTVFSDGVGVVVLKRLDHAQADGDRIDGLIRGWAVNNDGSNKASFMAPSLQGHASVIAQAQDHAGVRPHEISYVETHGTGTPVGDPMEFGAFERAFRRDTDARGFCGLGSVKSNIGHADTAAGIAGLIKTILALKHRELPATLHYRSPNPEIDLAASPFYVVDRLRPWTTNGDSRIAGVSSLGVGGTNCHVIVAEAPAPDHAETEELPCYLVPLSAATPEALDALAASYRDFVAAPSCPGLASIAATAQRHRAHHAFRMAVRCASVQQLRAGLSGGSAPGRWAGHVTPASDPRIGFMFAGQGSQHPGMGRQLFECNSEFRRLLQECDRLVRNHLDRPLLDVMFDDADGGAWLQRTEFAQPALFALEYSLAELLRRWGIRPRFVIGHSAGEYVAACIAGVFTLEEGIVLAAARGRLMQGLPGGGGMRAVAANADAIADVLRPFAGRVSIAAINSPTQTVLSGDLAALEQLGADLQARGINSRALSVSHAFHSAQMAPAIEPLAALVGRLQLTPPTVRLISNLTGRVATDDLTDPGYWSAHARQPVQFAAGIETLIEEGCDTLIEIGPDGLLSHVIRDGAGRRIDTVATLQRGEHDWDAMLETLARSYVRGVRVDWAALQSGRTTPPVRLPAYPFQRSRHWYQGPLLAAATAASAPAAEGHPLLGKQLRLPGSTEIRFEARFSQVSPQFLSDHRLFGVSLPPGASHLSMLAQAATILDGTPTHRVAPFRFEALHLLRPLLLPDGMQRDVQLICRPASHGWNIELTSAEARADGLPAGEWITHMIGRGTVLAAGQQIAIEPRWDLAAIRASCGRRVSGADFYASVWANHGGTGSSFRWIESIWQGERVALCRAVCPAGIVDRSAYRLHPGVIESACQVLHCCGDIETAEHLEATGITYIPFSVDIFTLHDVTADHDEVWCHARLRELTPENVVADLAIVSASGQVVATLQGFCLRPITREAVVSAATSANRHRREGADKSLPAADAAATAVRPGVDAMTPRITRVPSRHDVEQGLVEIWERSLQVKPVGITDNFFELGGDSLTAVRVFSTIEAVFGKTLSIAALFQSPTIATLADRILERLAADNNPWLVEMQRGEARGIPFFCVHGIGGNVVAFRELMQHLGSDQPMYGIEARGLYDDHPPDTSVEEMAAQYVAGIKVARPRGPYALAGYSSGGVVAFEMARQLTAGGARVALLALLDAPAMGSYRLLPASTRLRQAIALLRRRITYHSGNLWRLGRHEKIDYLARRGRRLRKNTASRLWQMQFFLYSALGRPLAPGHPQTVGMVPDRFRSVTEQLTLAARRYTPRPYSGAATLFRARDNPANFLVDPALGWGGLVERLDIREVPGGHETLLAMPHVQVLASELKACLNQARDTDRAIPSDVAVSHVRRLAKS
jgi:acyl transferase domain-containing protein/thioesterase domain-containing protein